MKAVCKDMVGLRFGRWTVEARADNTRSGQAAWACVCECGGQRNVPGYDLRAGKSKSCGCLAQENRTKHGLHKSPLYVAWNDMKQRCLNPNNPSYPDYGGRGIKVCDRWLDFQQFVADVGERPQGKTLDRVDVNGDYAPDNFRWATRSEQQNNRRKPARLRDIPRAPNPGWAWLLNA